MLSSIQDSVLSSLSDVSQNPIALVIFGIISVLVVFLILATIFPFWRRTLVTVKILEHDERPSSLLLWVITIVVIVKLTQVYLVQPFIVDGGSMLPTFHNQEFLLVDKLSYRLGGADRGDVAIFRLYEGGSNPYNGKYLIKRVIGLPGEHVVIRNGETTIYNKDNPNGFTLDESYVTFKDITKNVDITLDDHHYFMMGDNRAQSYDSRDWGPLDAANLRGQVLFRIYPVSAAGYEPGRFLYTK
jgi:signal peptidase I